MALRNFMATRSEADTSSGSERAEGKGTVRRSAAPGCPPREIAPSTSVDVTSVFEGELHCKETLRIDGRVTGKVDCEKMVLIGECAVVQASISADVVQISGEVTGNIAANSKITLSRTARVTGDLTTPGIVIEEGAKLKGQIMINSDDKPARESKSVEKPRSEVKPAPTAPEAAAPVPA